MRSKSVFFHLFLFYLTFPIYLCYTVPSCEGVASAVEAWDAKYGDERAWIFYFTEES